MRTHSEIVAAIPDLAGFVGRLGLSVHTARSWRQRNSIPPEHWKALVSDDLATPSELIAWAAKRPGKKAKAA
jgi:hypothetical protein